MKPLEEQMAFYEAYHRKTANKLTHFIGVPAIIFSLFVPLGWLRLDVGGISITAAMLFAAVVFVYYYRLDVVLALAMTLFIACVLWAANRAALLPMAEGGIIFGVAFVGGWIFQLTGHAIEGRRPALMDNFFQVFIAPIFLMAEVFFAAGYRPHIKARVKELSGRF